MICPACDRPLGNVEGHTYHDPGCPVIGQDPWNAGQAESGYLAALADCRCDQARECHPMCCPVCRAVRP